MRQMKNRTIRLYISAIAVIAATMTFTGCGGSSDPSVDQNPVNITRATEGAFSESARVLAARDAEKTNDIWISAATARAYEADLSLIRREFPETADIQTFPRYDLRSVIVTLSPGASWARGWTTENMATGEPVLDALLQEYSLEKIERIGDFDRSTTDFFVLRFAQSLNTNPLAERIHAASGEIATASINGIGGDGNNIVRKTPDQSDGSRRYIFRRGSGDCPSGCIERTTWEYAVSQDGKTATLIEHTGGLPK